MGPLTSRWGHLGGKSGRALEDSLWPGAPAGQGNADQVQPDPQSLENLSLEMPPPTSPPAPRAERRRRTLRLSRLRRKAVDPVIVPGSPQSRLADQYADGERLAERGKRSGGVERATEMTAEARPLCGRHKAAMTRAQRAWWCAREHRVDPRMKEPGR